MDKIPESDWKILSELKPRLLARLCENILIHVRARCEAEERTPHECFLNVFSDVEEGNDAIADAFDDLRRSNAIQRIARMKEERLFRGGEFSRFSAETRETVKAYGGMVVPSKFVPRG